MVQVFKILVSDNLLSIPYLTKLTEVLGNLLLKNEQ